MGAIDVVEAAYRPSVETRDWTARVLEAAGPVLDRGHGSFALMVDSMRPGHVRIGDFVLRNASEAVRRFVEEATRGLPQEDFDKTYGSPAVFDSMSGRAGATYAPDHWMFKAFRENLGLVDFDLVRAVDPGGFGCLLAAGRTSLSAPTAREKARWGRIAAHIVAGLRVHRSMRAESAEVALTDRPAVEAVLEPGGKVLHAVGPATKDVGRDSLRAAARAMDQSRSTMRTRAPEEALAAWQALVAGRWSLVDVFDNDGKRFVVARENRPHTEPVKKLTRREQDVVGYARQGWPNKLTAYTLGLAESTVSETLRRALEKLGLRSRLDLVRAPPARGEG